MARYTIEIDTLLKDPNFKLFDFDYNFYDEGHKADFERKFIDYYRYYEIGFETVYRFKHQLKELLNRKHIYYDQLYMTELRSKEIDFMLNKDLVETFERDVQNLTNTKSNVESNTLGKESFLDNGNADINLEHGNLTGVTGEDSSGLTETENKSDNKEKTELISKGNIGITSSADLLRQWRDVLINIDEIIIEDCRELFILIY